MQLPAFIARLVGFADKAEAQLDALAKAQAEILPVKTELATVKAELETARADNELLRASVKDASAKLTQQAAEIATLKTSVETEQKRANDVIASQGLSLESLPKSSPAIKPTSATGNKKQTLTEECIAAKQANAK